MEVRPAHAPSRREGLRGGLAGKRPLRLPTSREIHTTGMRRPCVFAPIVAETSETSRETEVEILVASASRPADRFGDRSRKGEP